MVVKISPASRKQKTMPAVLIDSEGKQTKLKGHFDFQYDSQVFAGQREDGSLIESIDLQSMDGEPSSLDRPADGRYHLLIESGEGNWFDFPIDQDQFEAPPEDRSAEALFNDRIERIGSELGGKYDVDREGEGMFREVHFQAAQLTISKMKGVGALSDSMGGQLLKLAQREIDIMSLDLRAIDMKGFGGFGQKQADEVLSMLRNEVKVHQRLRLRETETPTSHFKLQSINRRLGRDEETFLLPDAIELGDVVPSGGRLIEDWGGVQKDILIVQELNEANMRLLLGEDRYFIFKNTQEEVHGRLLDRMRFHQ
ncbi:MAG: hypothetical protein ABH851_06305 [Methanobacteriota archaeon]